MANNTPSNGIYKLVGTYKMPSSSNVQGTFSVVVLNKDIFEPNLINHPNDAQAVTKVAYAGQVGWMFDNGRGYINPVFNGKKPLKYESMKRVHAAKMLAEVISFKERRQIGHQVILREHSKLVDIISEAGIVSQ